MKSMSFYLLSILLFAFCFPSTKGEDILLPPPPCPSARIEKMIVLFQGALVPNDRYTSLMKMIQESSCDNKIKLWVAIPQFTFNFAEPEEGSVKLANAIAQVQKMGFQNVTQEEDVFLAGHSQGGIVARSVFSMNKLRGLLLLASYLSIDGTTDLFHYEGDVLTVGGEMDGLTRISRMAEEVNQFVRYGKQFGTKYALIHKPVIIVPGINHSQYVRGMNISLFDVIYDLVPDVDIETAQERIATTITSFLSVQSFANTDAEFKKSLVKLAKASDATLPLVSGFLEAHEVEGNGWCVVAQEMIINSTVPINKNQMKVNQIEYENLVSFAISKPSISQSSANMVSITNSNHNSFIPNPEDMAAYLLSALDVGCKMKTQRAVTEKINVNTGREGTCQDVNQAAFQFAFTRLQPHQIARYQAHGVQLAFQPDIMYSAGVTWIDSSLTFESSNSNSYNVISPKLETALNEPFGLGGMCYCYLLSPGRALEWMIIDSLPHLS